MKKIADLVVSIGKYTNKDGKEKNRYINVGSKMQKDDGSSFLLLNRTFNPAGVPNPDNRDSVILSLFEVKDNTSTETPKVMEPEDIKWEN